MFAWINKKMTLHRISVVDDIEQQVILNLGRNIKIAELKRVNDAFELIRQELLFSIS